MEKLELLKALHKAKLEIGKVSKDSTNPHFKNKYFDINTLLETVEPILLKHGMIVLQPITDNKVQSIIFHAESGQSIYSEMMLSNDTNPQKKGSEITYYRRYTLQSLLSLQAEDDDANLASAKTSSTNAPKKETLTSTHPKYKAVLEALKSGNYTISQVKAKYEISSEVEKELLK